MNIVVMIPAYNEEKTIAEVIRKIPRDFATSVKILTIDDGSSDSTFQQAKLAGSDKIVRHGTNRGLGPAFKTGLYTALGMGADIIVNIDADNQFDPTDIPKLVDPIIKDQADMVTCTRFSDPQLIPNMPYLKKLGNNFFTALINFVTHHKFTDTQCGFRAYSREASLRMTLFGRFTYTQEVFLDLSNKGMRIQELPCRVKGQRDGDSRVVNNVVSYGIKALLIIILTLRDHRALKFFGGIGTGMFSLGLLTGIFLSIRWTLLGKINPYMILVWFSLTFLILGFLMILLGLIADMLERSRKLQEEILYQLRRK